MDRGDHGLSEPADPLTGRGLWGDAALDRLAERAMRCLRSTDLRSANDALRRLIEEQRPTERLVRLEKYV